MCESSHGISPARAVSHREIDGSVMSVSRLTAPWAIQSSSTAPDFSGTELFLELLSCVFTLRGCFAPNSFINLPCLLLDNFVCLHQILVKLSQA